MSPGINRAISLLSQISDEESVTRGDFAHKFGIGRFAGEGWLQEVR